MVECKANKCLILTYNGLEWVKRSLIGIEKGQKDTSTPEEPEASGVEDGPAFCFYHARDEKLWKKVDEYYKKNKKSTTKSSKETAKEIINAIKNCSFSKFTRYIHPKDGITLSYFPDFYRVKNNLNRGLFASYYHNYKKLYWGESEGRGDKIKLNLKNYCKEISKAVKKPTQLKKVSLKQIGFKPVKGAVAYKYSKQKSYGWIGAILVLKKYNGKWYLIGLAYDRWTI